MVRVKSSMQHARPTWRLKWPLNSATANFRCAQAAQICPPIQRNISVTIWVVDCLHGVSGECMQSLLQTGVPSLGNVFSAFKETILDLSDFNLTLPQLVLCCAAWRL